MKTDWDVAIIGAGPAGGVAAAMLAARGKRVLLIERSAWPRDKVCGGCLNARAVAALTEEGLGSALRGSRPIEQVAWHVGGRALEHAAPGGAAILRSEMDAAIVAEAVARGCTFLPGTSATLLPATADAHRVIRLRDCARETKVSASAILACDGIGGTSLSGESRAGWRISRKSWIGVSMTCNAWPGELDAKTIHMHVGRGGYAGLACMSDGRVHLAAALDPAACRKAGGPAPLIEAIFGSCGRNVRSDFSAGRFHGTGGLTRRRDRLGGHRVLAVGDACGYVEPFTGEGMAWAICCAREAVELLPAPDAQWPCDLADRWQAIHHATIGHRQRWCRGLRTMMHHPALAASAVAVGRAAPAVSSFLASRVCEVQPGGAA